MQMEMNDKQLVQREYVCNSTLHLREGEDSRTITGYAILFNEPSAPLYEDEDESIREVIAPEAITREFLDGCDIKMTMFHDRQLILARSNKGEGTLTYQVDEKGVSFTFDAPKTTDGDKALELVRRGDIQGCSFAFTTYYWDNSYVERSSVDVNEKTETTYRVKSVTGVYDFTLAADPAYPTTSVETREFTDNLKNSHRDDESESVEAKRELDKKITEQVCEMRKAAQFNL